MRLLHVVPTYFPAVRYGGPIYSVHSLCKALVELGHEVHVFTTCVDGDGDSDVPLDTPVDMDGVRVWYFPSPFLRRLYWSPAMGRRMRQMLPDFDLVHVHSVFLWPTTLACSLARRFNVPYVLAPRGMLVEDLIRARGRLRKEWWIRLFERRNLAGASALHLTSRQEELDYEALGLPARPILRVPNGVEEPEIAAPTGVGDDLRGMADPPGYLLTLGRISWKKGIDRLLRALQDLPDERLLVVGNDDEGLLPELNLLAEELGVVRRVRFLPRAVMGAEKEWVFSQARLFVIASRSENFGNVVPEAMIRGLPVVASRAVGAADLVVQASCGQVVEGDGPSLANGIGQVLDGDLQGMSSRGMKLVREEYSWGNLARGLVEGLEDLIPPRAKD